MACVYEPVHPSATLVLALPSYELKSDYLCPSEFKMVFSQTVSERSIFFQNAKTISTGTQYNIKPKRQTLSAPLPRQGR